VTTWQVVYSHSAKWGSIWLYAHKAKTTAVVLLALAAMIVFAPKLDYPLMSEGVAQSPAALTSTTNTTVTVASITTTTEISIRNLTSWRNITVVSNVTTPVLSNSDVTTVVLAIVAVAALVIAVYSLLKKRTPARPTGPAGQYPVASVSRVTICPSCGTSNKPTATYCRRCRTRLH
jgi:hypothetical protein